MAVAVVTDSTGYLPPDLAARHGIGVVPIRVTLGERTVRDMVEVGPAELIAALGDQAVAVGTSRPSPAEFAALFRELLSGGATEVVSVHLSRLLSGTWEAARIAADEVDSSRVRVVDSRSAGMGLGFATLAAARAAAAGGAGVVVEEAAADVAARSRVFFCVDSLEYLRRGGRIGAAAAWLGSALAVKPMLHVSDGLIEPLEKVRTLTRAVARMVDLAEQAAGRRTGGENVELAVHHLGAPERAAELAGRLAERLPAASPCVISEVGAALGAHAGPGLLGVVVVPPASD
ncbi:DegV family protein [Pseudonocardia eucalypti]|uniref:DegV family protein n=1 Tax=Pseudonocardia eucalypti TaxID=648755 RepID=A0ABP9PV50_9PSEU|nr:DegV family protein with EDD domain [Pseudonocardia eucalypti]